jgi:signal transduction histidine kinase
MRYSQAMKAAFTPIRYVLGLHPLVGPGLSALVLAGFGTTAALLNARAMGLEEPATATIVVLSLLLTLPLVLVGRFPLSTLMLTTAVIILYRHLGVPEQLVSLIAIFLAIYGAGAYGRSRHRDWVRGGAILVLFGVWFYWAFTRDAPELPVDYIFVQVYTFMFNVFLFGSAWILGDVVRRGRTHEADLVRHAHRMEGEREENARRAVEEERVRIARDLHDVVAHHVSVMGVQAGAARRVLARRPADAEGALASIEESSRQAVGELQRMLDLLRRDGEADGLAPQPGLRQIGTLTRQMQEAGLRVSVRRVGEAQSLPAGIDVSAYRIVQEALTNTLKHAGPAHADITLRYAPRELNLEILDNGRRASRSGNGEDHGRGLLGMRERVGLLGGELETGRRPEGGFAVRARLPIPSR